MTPRMTNPALLLPDALEAAWRGPYRSRPEGGGGDGAGPAAQPKNVVASRR